ncbi:MAG: hypothetical protein KCHDKBKB_01386 [Elusimicrobia bacterium]|nr:hypothetical protein [Elusimicrobiota bacterium]
MKSDKQGKSFPFVFSGMMLAIAALLRFSFLLVWKTRELENIFSFDPYVYLAQYWLGWYPDANELIIHCVAPGFAGFVALLFWLSGGVNFEVIRICNLVLSTLTVWVTGWYAFKIMGRSSARITMLVMAVAPVLIFFTPHLQSESFYLFWQMVFFLLLISFWDQANIRRAFFMGLFGGFLALTRSVFVLYLPFLLIALFFQAKKKGKSVTLLLFLVGGWMLPIAVRTAANWHFYKKFIPLTAQGGQDLYLGIGRYAEDRAVRMREVAEKSKEGGYGYDRWVDRDKFLRGEALAYIKAHPIEYGVTVAIKFLRYWRPWPYAPYPLKARFILGIYYSVLFLLALSGVWLLRERFVEFLPVYGFFLTLSITHAFLDTSLRYRVPLEPFLIVWTSYALSKVWSSMSKMTKGHVAPVKN